jgi:hypothetical protein
MPLSGSNPLDFLNGAPVFETASPTMGHQE